MTTPDFPDYTTPVALREQVANLVTLNTAWASGYASPVFDTSGAAQLALQVQAGVGTVGDRWAFYLQWQEGNVTNHIDLVSGHSFPSYQYTAAMVGFTIPVKASRLLVQAFADASVSGIYNLTASTRVPNGNGMIGSRSGGNRLLANASTGSVAAGATSSPIYLPPVAYAYRIRYSGRSNLSTANLTAVVAPSGAATVVSYANWTGDQDENAGGLIVAPGMGMFLTITNTDTAAHSYTVTAVDAS